MSELGVFAVDRGIFDHPLFDDGQPFSRREAWLWLVKEASWKARPYGLTGKIIQLQRGQLAHSVRYMATAWRWSKSSVDRFLVRLKTETMIGTESGTGVLVITICNYEAYQAAWTSNRDSNRDADRDTSGTAAGQKRTKKPSNIPPTPKGEPTPRNDADTLQADFDANVWPKRWKRTGHNPSRAFRAYSKLKPAEREACKASIDRCARHIVATASAENYRPLLSTWINSKGWLADSSEAGAPGQAGIPWEQWIAAFRKDGSWNPAALGPEPGKPGCRAPAKFFVQAVA